MCFTPPNRGRPTDVRTVAGSTSDSGARSRWPPTTVGWTEWLSCHKSIMNFAETHATPVRHSQAGNVTSGGYQLCRISPAAQPGRRWLGPAGCYIPAGRAAKPLQATRYAERPHQRISASSVPCSINEESAFSLIRLADRLKSALSKSMLRNPLTSEEIESPRLYSG